MWHFFENLQFIVFWDTLCTLLLQYIIQTYRGWVFNLKKEPLILSTMNESQKNKRRIALAVPKIKLERKNNKSQVLTIGVGRTTILRGGADLGVIIHSTWRQTHCCIDNDSKYTMTWHPTRLLVVLYLIMRYYKVPKSQIQEKNILKINIIL